MANHASRRAPRRRLASSHSHAYHAANVEAITRVAKTLCYRASRVSRQAMMCCFRIRLISLEGGKKDRGTVNSWRFFSKVPMRTLDHLCASYPPEIQNKTPAHPGKFKITSGFRNFWSSFVIAFDEVERKPNFVA